MAMWNALANIAASHGGFEGREKPRFRANEMLVDHGVVKDFSATGLRIKFSRCPRYKVGQEVELTLQNYQGERHCFAKVVWIKKTGWRSKDIGFRFANADVAEEMQLFKAAFDPLGDGKWSNQ